MVYWGGSGMSGGSVKSFSFNKVEHFTDTVHFGSIFSEYTSATDLTPQNIRFDICTTINTNVPDKGQLQNYTILFKSAPSLSSNVPDSNPNTPAGVINCDMVGFILTSGSDRTNRIQFRVYEDEVGLGKRFWFYYKQASNNIAGKTTVVIDNPSFQVSSDFNIQPITYNTSSYLDATFYYYSSEASFENYYTKSQIDAKTTVLQAGIDTTYDKVASDARYRKIVDSYTKSEVLDRLSLKSDGLALAAYYTKVESDNMLASKANYDAAVLPFFQ